MTNYIHGSWYLEIPILAKLAKYCVFIHITEHISATRGTSELLEKVSLFCALILKVSRETFGDHFEIHAFLIIF